MENRKKFHAIVCECESEDNIIKTFEFILYVIHVTGRRRQIKYLRVRRSCSFKNNTKILV